MNFFSAVARCHIMMGLSTKNIPNQVNVIKKLGRFGTGIPIAPVCRAGGKLSTGFPPGTRRADHCTLQMLSFAVTSERAPQI